MRDLSCAMKSGRLEYYQEVVMIESVRGCRRGSNFLANLVRMRVVFSWDGLSADRVTNGCNRY